MRNRFFFIILATLILSAIGINLVHVKFFKSQRLKLIDKQIAESSSMLLASHEFIQSVQSPHLIEETISKVLQGARIGKVFVIRDSASRIIFQSINVSLLRTEVPIQPEWVAVETAEEYIRVRNISLQTKQKLILQVGLVLDRNFINWEIVDSQVIKYISAIISAIFLASVLLTLVLLSPLRLLITHLQDATSNLTNMKDVNPLPKRLLRYANGFWARSDEFSSLLNTIQKLIDRINLNYKLTRSWTFQMAHELKTPLAIMRADTQYKKKGGLLPVEYANETLREIDRMSDTITQFLEWAELENSQLQKNLHAIRMKSLIGSVVLRLDKISPGRIRLDLVADFSVFGNPTHIDQLVCNLITNALKFSPVSQPVDVILNKQVLLIRDLGPGFPAEVRERLGQPFNVGLIDDNSLKGSGLGLAWVMTVAKLYQWEFNIRSLANGTEVELKFGNEDIIDE